MPDLKLLYASFKSLMGTSPVYYTTGADGSYKAFCFPLPGGDMNYAIIAGSNIADFDANVKPTATAVASQDEARALNNGSSASTTTNVAQSASAVTLKAANPNRKSLTIWNDSGLLGQNLFIKLGSGASATSYTVLLAQGEGYEMPLPIYPGIVTGIWSAGTGGSARVTETT